LLGLNGSLQALGRARAIIGSSLVVAAFLGIATWTSSAQASGCTNTFTNTAGGSWFTATNWSKGKVPTSTEEACITESGTYTVVMTQTSTTGTVTVKSLAIGGASGTQTLAVGSSGSLNAVLTTSEGLANAANGSVTMTNGDGAGNSVTLAGPIANAGTLTTVPAVGGNRTLQGNITNTGTVQINTNTELDEGKTLTNEGAVDIAEGKTLNVSGKSAVVNGSGGKIAGTGSGDIFVKGSGTSFTEGAGTTSGTQPVIVDDSALSYTGAGESFIKLRGTSTLSGSLGAAQSLSIESTGGENASVTAGASFTNAGSITETNGDGAGNSETLIVTSPSTLSNSGTITTQQANGGGRAIQGNIKNTGTIQVNANTEYNGESATLTNDGAIDLATEKTLKVSDKGAVVNGVGGSINGTGTGDLLLASGTSFTEGAGTTSGTQPVIVDDSTLTYTGGGESLIKLRGTSTLSGTSSAGQSLSIESTGGENANVTASPSFSNGGSIKLTNGDGAGNNETLAGTVVNSGTLTTEQANGGSRTLAGSLKNTGTLQINANTEYDGEGATLTNEGAIGLATEKTLKVSNKGAVINGTGGSISAGSGTGDLLVTGSGTSFTQGAGTTSGTQPVILDDSALSYTGTGASFIKLRGTSTLSGNLGSAQSLSIESTGGENAIVTAAASFTNAGTITMTNGDASGNSATFVTSSGTLTNSGTIVTEPAHGGGRTIEGNLTNTGAMKINANTEYGATGATLLNKGTIEVATGVSLRATSKEVLVNETAGNIVGVGTGALVQTGGTFEQGAGKTTGTQPAVLDDLTLKYTGKGASKLALRGSSSLSGTINKGQTLSLQSTGGENAAISAASFLSSGTIVLTNGDGAGNSVTLNLAGGTLENKGKLEVERANGGSRTIEGAIKNEKTLFLGAGATLKLTGNYSQGKKATLEVAINSASSFGSMSVGGTASLEGALTLKQSKTFKPASGEKFAIITAGTRTGTFAKVNKATIAKTTLKYEPSYSPTGVTLVVT